MSTPFRVSASSCHFISSTSTSAAPNRFTTVAKRPRRIPQSSISTTSFIPTSKTRRHSLSNRCHRHHQHTHTHNDHERLLHTKTKRYQSSPEMQADAAVIGGVKEALEFLAATTIIIPIFRRLNLSPILGFLLGGVVLGPYGLRLISDVEDVAHLADFGVLFLLFEMGLELSLDRLRKLRKYAFGMGTLQIFLTATVLGLGAYAMGGTIQESAVVGAALSLSSSAFILQILAEKGERQSRAGIATFGVLLMQDIAVVPLLLLVPLLGAAKLGIEMPRFTWMAPSDLHAMREGAGHVIAALGTLNFVVLAGGAFLKRVFSFVADSRSPEAFTSAVLLTVLGTSFVTEQMGLSMTMGAFLAGVLLAESSFRSRIKVDLEPFRGLFLGLFFITTGMSLDLNLFVTQPVQIAFLISSLIFCKTAVTTLVGLPFGLSLAESLRVGLLLGQGGEFAFVLFALANKLGYLPDDANAFLTTTVVVTMALTPLLYEAGSWIAPRLDKMVASSGGTATTEATIQEVADPGVGFVLICGYGPVGKVVGRMLSRKFIRWVAVDIDRKTVSSAVENNLAVIYGDSTKPAELLAANNLSLPDAFVITYSDDELVDDALGALRSLFPDRQVFLRAKSLKQQKEYLERGAKAMYPETFETSLQLGQSVLKGFNTSDVDVKAIKAEVRGDYGLTKTFQEYEEWFLSPDADINTEANGADVEIVAVSGNGIASSGSSETNGRHSENDVSVSELDVNKVASPSSSSSSLTVENDPSAGGDEKEKGAVASLK